jgi:hypothetical protein
MSIKKENKWVTEFKITKKGIQAPSDKNYNPIIALSELFQSLKGDGSWATKYNELVKEKQTKATEKNLQKKLEEKISEGTYSKEDIESRSDEIRKDLLKRYPELEFSQITLTQKILPAIKAYGGSAIKSGGSHVAQKIGEKASGVPMVGPKIASFFEKIGYDPKKTQKKAIPFFSPDGSVNLEAFSDPNRDSFSKFAIDVFVSKPISLVMKIGGGLVGGSIFITILGPIGVVPMIALQYISFKSTFESIAVEIPEKLFTLITSTILNGFKQVEFKDVDKIHIEFEGGELFIKSDQGVIVGMTKMNPEEIEQAKIIEIAKDPKKTLEEKESLINGLTKKFSDAFKEKSEISETKNTDESSLKQISNQVPNFKDIKIPDDSKNSKLENPDNFARKLSEQKNMGPNKNERGK